MWTLSCLPPLVVLRGSLLSGGKKGIKSCWLNLTKSNLNIHIIAILGHQVLAMVPNKMLSIWKILIVKSFYYMLHDKKKYLVQFYHYPQYNKDNKNSGQISISPTSPKMAQMARPQRGDLPAHSSTEFYLYSCWIVFHFPQPLLL